MDSVKPGDVSHLRYIDALRGIAFLAVMTVHVGAAAQYIGFGLVPAGMYGVQLFFLISAVTLLRSHAQRQERGGRAIAGFYLRRISRIAPLFWCGIVFYLWLDGRGPRFWAPNGLKNWEIAATALFVHAWTPPSLDSVVPGGWSIGVEMIFYFWLPLMWNRIRSAAVAVLCVIAALLLNLALIDPMHRCFSHAFRHESAALLNEYFFLWFPAQLSVFLLGFVLYFLLSDAQMLARLRTRFAPTALLVAGAYLFFCITRLGAPPQLPFSTMYAVAWSLIVLSLAAWPNPLLVNRVTTTIGTLSFSCYLAHFAMLELTQWLLARWQPHAQPPGMRFILLWVSTLLLTVAAAMITYGLIERPGVRFGNFLIRKWKLNARTVPANSHAVTQAPPIS